MTPTKEPTEGADNALDKLGERVAEVGDDKAAELDPPEDELDDPEPTEDDDAA